MTPQERACGCLLGLAVGDALGFPLEGLTPRQIQRRYPDLSRYRFLGRRGFVSDDTEQAVMVAEAVLETGGEPSATARAFARRLVAWFWTIPPGVGMATVRACLSWTVGRRQGVASAGNGAAMRAAALGLWPQGDRALDEAVARVTHTDPRGVDAARVVAEGVRSLLGGGDASWPELKGHGFDPRLEQALEKAWEARTQTPEELARLLGTTGYVLHSVPLAYSALWREPASFDEGLLGVLRQGGDADSNGAIAGALLGARFGAGAIETTRLADLEPGFSSARLETLARSLVEGRLEPGYRPPGFLARRWREAQIKTGVGLHVLRRMVWFV